MKRAAVSTLKATLSACLAKVKAGDEVLVVERGKPIAKLVPLSKDSHESDTLHDLARGPGPVRLGTSKLPAGFWKLPRPKDREGRGLKAIFWQIGLRAMKFSGRLRSDPSVPSGTRKPLFKKTAPSRPIHRHMVGFAD